MIMQFELAFELEFNFIETLWIREGKGLLTSLHQELNLVCFSLK